MLDRPIGAPRSQFTGDKSLLPSDIVNTFMDNVKECLSSRNTCVLAFGSNNAHELGTLPHFDFVNFLNSLEVDYVLLRDPELFWYQKGIPDIGSVPEVVNYVKNLVSKYDRVITLGVSMGGFAALLFGYMAGVIKIIAISPQTFTGSRVLSEFSDGQPSHFGDLHVTGDFCDIRDHENSQTEAICYVSDKDGTKYDLRYAQRLKHPKIVLIPGQSHAGLAKYMRDTGLLREILIG